MTNILDWVDEPGWAGLDGRMDGRRMDDGWTIQVSPCRYKRLDLHAGAGEGEDCNSGTVHNLNSQGPNRRTMREYIHWQIL